MAGLDVELIVEDDGFKPEIGKQKTEKLTELSMKMGQAIYQQQQEAGAADAAEGGEAGSGDSSSEDEDVVEAEFSEVDEDEKS